MTKFFTLKIADINIKLLGIYFENLSIQAIHLKCWRIHFLAFHTQKFSQVTMPMDLFRMDGFIPMKRVLQTPSWLLYENLQP